MKIGIVTVYDGVSNAGSYLQAYAMKYVLEELGHKVYFVEKISVSKRILQHICRINPKRAFFIRIKNGINYFRDSKCFRFVKPKNINCLDGLVFGSDEIWNMDNGFFRDPLFFGTGISLPKIAYATSVGAMEQNTLEQNGYIVEGLRGFRAILARDERTRKMLCNQYSDNVPLVCDPTLLINKDILHSKIRLPRQKYILVYSYGMDESMQKNIIRFAKEKDLKIISAHFWHLFCDKVIPCRPLQLGTLMAGAEYVFTSTFHGALFAMMNHTKCAIMPVREKVSFAVRQLGQEARLIDENKDYETFKKIIEMPFDSQTFDARLKELRKDSEEKLEAALKCLEN